MVMCLLFKDGDKSSVPQLPYKMNAAFRLETGRSPRFAGQPAQPLSGRACFKRQGRER